MYRATFRGNQHVNCSALDITQDPIWNTEDHERANALFARLQSLHVSTTELPHLVACMAWKAKFPGLKYDEELERRIAALVCRA